MCAGAGRHYYDMFCGRSTVCSFKRSSMSSDAVFFFSSRRRHTRSYGDWSSDVCSSDLRASRGWADSQQSRASIDFATRGGRVGSASRSPREMSISSASVSVTESPATARSEEHTSELQSPYDLVCRLLLEKKKKKDRKIV